MSISGSFITLSYIHTPIPYKYRPKRTTSQLISPLLPSKIISIDKSMEGIKSLLTQILPIEVDQKLQKIILRFEQQFFQLYPFDSRSNYFLLRIEDHVDKLYQVIYKWSWIIKMHYLIYIYGIKTLQLTDCFRFSLGFYH